MRISFITLLAVGVLIHNSAYAACTGGIEGQIEYETVANVYRYCNGTDWVNITDSGGASEIDDLSDATKDLTDSNLFIATTGGSHGDNNDYNTAVGINALSSLDNDATANAGDFNTALGYNALYYNTTGNSNTASGYRALYSNTTGIYNTASGVNAMRLNTTGTYNTASGHAALYSNTTGIYNTASGVNAGRYISDGTTANETGSNGVFLGTNTKANADGENNQIVIGHNATGAGSNSVVLGNDSITKTLLKGNVGIGTTSPTQKLHVAGNVRATGGTLQLPTDATDTYGLKISTSTDTTTFQSYNNLPNFTFKASTSLERNFQLIPGASFQTFGYSGSTATALYIKDLQAGMVRAVIDSSGNVGIGTTGPDRRLDILDASNPQLRLTYTDGSVYTDLQATSAGTLNIIPTSKKIALNGTQMLYYPEGNFTGTLVIGDGGGSLSYTTGTEGQYNTFVGKSAGQNNTIGAYNSSVGYAALQSNTTGSRNIAIGNSALRYNTTGGWNTAVGNNALGSNTSGNNNTANGYQALYSNTTGLQNIANGYQALYSNTTGLQNIANGYQALYSNTTGNYNTGIGYNALFGIISTNQNTALGYNAGFYIADAITLNTTGSHSTFLGGQTKANADGESNQIVIGYNATGAGSNSVVLGNDSITKTLLKGNVGIGTTSPQARLSLGSDNQAQKLLIYENGNTRYGLGQVSNEMRFFSPGGAGNRISFGNISTTDGITWTENIRILGSGSVGIGTTSPDGLLDIEGGGVYVSEIAAPSTPNAGKGVIYAGTDSKLYYKDDGGTAHDLTFTTDYDPGTWEDVTSLHANLTDSVNWQCRMDSMRQVFIAGTLYVSSTISSGTTIGVLPAACRPSTTISSIVLYYSTTGSKSFSIDTSGNFISNDGMQQWVNYPVNTITYSNAS